MPFVSSAQRRFMHAKHPDIAARWDKETPKNKKLPKHVKKSKPKPLAILNAKRKAIKQLTGIMKLRK